MFNRTQITDLVGQLAHRSLPAFEYCGRREGDWFFRQPVEGPQRPAFRWACLSHSRSARSFTVSLALSYFSDGRQACKAVHLSRVVALSRLSGRSYDYRSKRSAEQVLEWIAVDLNLYRLDFYDRALEALEEDEQVMEGLEFLNGCESGTELDEVLKVRFDAELGQELALYFRLEEPEDEPDDEMSAFLSQLRSEGEKAETGTFTLEAGKAREKLAQFQLEDPRAFVVHLVAGAVAHGAGRVEVYLDSDDVMVDFDGPSLGRASLEQLFSSLLSDDSEQAHLRHWAVGLQGASHLAPRRLWFQTQSSDSNWRLTVTHESHEVGEHPPTQKPMSHRFHFRAPADLAAVGRFFSKLRGPLPEARHLQARCGLAPVLLSLNGVELAPPERKGYSAYLLCESEKVAWKRPADLDYAGYSQRLDSSKCTALLGLSFTTVGEVWFVVNGLLYGAPTVNWNPICEVTVWLSSATTDLSQRNLVSDVALMKQVKLLQEREEEFLQAILRDFPEIEQAHQNLLAVRFLGLLVEQRLSETVENLLKKQPVYDTVGGERFSLNQLSELKQVYYTNRDWEFPTLEGLPVVVVKSGDLGRPLHQLFPELRSGDPLLEKAKSWHERRRAWLAQPSQEPRMHPRDGKVVRPLEGLRGELGLSLGKEQIEIRTLGRALPLASSFYRWLPPGLSLVVEGDHLEANDDWTEIRRGEALESLVAAVEASLDSYYLSLSGELELERVRHGLINYLGWLAQRKRRLGPLEELPIFEVQEGLLKSRRASLEVVRKDQLEVRSSPAIWLALSQLGLLAKS